MSTPDLTFTIHPRPPEEPPRLSDAVLDLGPPAGPTPADLAEDLAEDQPDESDGFLANLAFLVRFAFGRY